jgi:tight adherence protein B
MVATAIGGVAYVFIYPLLSGERKVEQRRANVARASARRVDRLLSHDDERREQVEETLKEIDVKANKPKSLPLPMKIAQAGLSWSKNQFLMISAGLGLVGFLAVFVMAGNLLPALGVGFAAAFGVPRWLLSFLKKRREKKFLNHFPDGVDVIVRGIKSGLPLLDSLKIIALDARDTSRGIQGDRRPTIGMPIGKLRQLYERMRWKPTAWHRDFDSAEGRRNLSRRGNLSRVCAIARR